MKQDQLRADMADFKAHMVNRGTEQAAEPARAKHNALKSR